jgi:hypothetical protein
VAGHHLIDGYLATLAEQLPYDAVDELADGLAETFNRHLSTAMEPDMAARAAIAEFGEPGLVVAAFVRHSPGRRTARALLCLGPAVGVCWAAALIDGHAWDWPVPVAVRLMFGTALLVIVAALVLAATGHTSYRRTRITAMAALGVICLDGGILATVLLAAPAFAWPMTFAVTASLTRIALTTRAMPKLLTR